MVRFYPVDGDVNRIVVGSNLGMHIPKKTVHKYSYIRKSIGHVVSAVALRAFVNLVDENDQRDQI
jgi:hypothetical protein